MPRRFWFGLLAAALCLSAAAAAAAKDEKKSGGWAPIPPEEFALTDNPAQPGAPAMILYRELYTDDIEGYETHYSRIKIFTEEGRKHADVEIPYVKGVLDVKEIRARTVQPDGTVVEFDGRVFDRVLIKARGIKVQAKTFTLPDVRSGSIIEYRYKLEWNRLVLFPTTWLIQQNLFTRRARFRLEPDLNTAYNLRWTSILRTGMDPRWNEKDKMVGLDLENIPALVEEEFMPPEEELQLRVNFYYTRLSTETPDQFWTREGKEWYEVAENFIGKPKKFEKAVAGLVAPGDPPEAKLRKLYARVQQVRNLSYESEKTEKEEERQKLKDNNNAEDVQEHGYGYRSQINRLFVAMARAAGFTVDVVRVAARDNIFFRKELLDWRQLNAEVALVQLEGRELYLDPATPHCPFGLLAWQRTGVRGIRLAKNGGVFVTTPEPAYGEALTERKASLRLEEDGTMGGTLEISFGGQEALRRRLIAMEKDDTDRKKMLEDEVKGWLPTGASVELQTVNAWGSFDEPLRAQFTVKIPNLGTPTGRRLLLPVGVFHTTSSHLFQHVQRVHPVYFDYPYEAVDDVTVELPAGWQVESLPAARKRDPPFARYEMSSQKDGNKLRLVRSFVMNWFYFGTDFYPGLRSFYDTVRTADEQQAVLQQTSAAGGN